MANPKYYIVRVAAGEQFPFLKMHNDSLRTLKEGFDIGSSAPLQFENGWREENIEEGLVEVIGDVLFSGSKILISDKIKNSLESKANELQQSLPVEFYPAVYITDNDDRLEAYWYVNIDNRIDCWDKDKSTFRSVPTDDQVLYQIEEFHLDRGKLETSAGRDLIFKISNNVNPPLVLKEDIAVYFDLPEVELIELSG